MKLLFTIFFSVSMLWKQSQSISYDCYHVEEGNDLSSNPTTSSSRSTVIGTQCCTHTLYLQGTHERHGDIEIFWDNMIHDAPEHYCTTLLSVGGDPDQTDQTECIYDFHHHHFFGTGNETDEDAFAAACTEKAGDLMERDVAFECDGYLYDGGGTIHHLDGGGGSLRLLLWNRVECISSFCTETEAKEIYRTAMEFISDQTGLLDCKVAEIKDGPLHSIAYPYPPDQPPAPMTIDDDEDDGLNYTGVAIFLCIIVFLFLSVMGASYYFVRRKKSKNSPTSNQRHQSDRSGVAPTSNAPAESRVAV